MTDVPAPIRDYFEASRVALALADARGDNPLLLVSPRFSELTGYPPADVIGRNCRMLQGEADNAEARTLIHEFLEEDRKESVRTPIVNFRRDGSAFVNLLYMSKLRTLGGEVRYLFASQFDVSRSQPELLSEYDRALSATLSRFAPVLAENGIVLEGSLTAIANSAATVAQAKLTLADLDASPYA